MQTDFRKALNAGFLVLALLLSCRVTEGDGRAGAGIMPISAEGL
jgi:hypothetical protein